MLITLMGTPTTRSLRAKTVSLAINIEGGIHSNQSSCYCHKTTSIQQRFGPNRTFFRLQYTNLYSNGKCTNYFDSTLL